MSDEPTLSPPDGAAGVFMLPAALTIYGAAALRTDLLHALDRTEALRCDLSEVTEIDCAGVQLLLVAAREAEARGLRFSLINPSAPVEEVLATLGVALPRDES